MKRIAIFSLLALTMTAWMAMTATAEHHEMKGSLSADERAQLLDLLEEARAETEAIAASATGDHWSTKNGDGWSAGETLEHVALAEAGLRGLAQMALGSPADEAWAESDTGVDGILGMMGDRSQKFQAPEMFQPKGTMSRDEVLALYATERAKTIDFFRSSTGPLKQHTFEGPPGKLNVQQWLAMVAAHNMRHNQQMKDAVAAAGS